MITNRVATTATIKCTLFCASPPCGKQKDVIGLAPQSRTELLQAVETAGWLWAQNGSLVALFCSKRCKDRNTTKSGFLRTRFK